MKGCFRIYDIGIITGYRGQKDLIRKSVNNSGYDRIAKEIDIIHLWHFRVEKMILSYTVQLELKTQLAFKKKRRGLM